MGHDEAIQLARDFVREQFVARGMVADLNVHWTRASDGELQPHAHVMLSMREVLPGRDGYPEEGGFGKKAVAWNGGAAWGGGDQRGRRQLVEWQRSATRELATACTEGAVDRYETAEMLRAMRLGRRR